MKRFKKGYALIFAMVMALSVFPSAPNVFADDIAKIKVSVQGDGVITISDTKSEYKINQGEVFKASVNVGSKLTLKMDANEGSLLGQVVLNGQNALGIETDTKSVSYDYVIQAGGADIKVNFIVDPNQGVEVETPNAGENTTTETPKEEVKEEPKEEVKEETPVEGERLELKIIKEYVAGIKNTKEQIEFRKNLATEKNLLEFVDENFFLKNDFWYSKSSSYFIDEGIVALVPAMSGAELGEFANTLSNVKEESNEELLKEKRSNFLLSLFGKETKETLYTGGGDGISAIDHNGYEVTAPLLTVGGRQAFCIEFEKITPNSGTLVTDKQESSNDMLRKILYYGYKGPGTAQLPDLWQGNQNLLMIATTMAASKANGHKSYTIGEELYGVISNPKLFPSPPSDFIVYTVSTGGVTQDLAFWEYSPILKGKLQISKVSAKPEITDGNDYYSVVGAEYGVYSDAEATKHLETLKIDSTGFSKEIELDVGTYYIKETKAPKGYTLDKKAYDVTVKKDDKVIEEFKDTPQNDPIGVALKKVDAETGLPVAVGEGTLEDAHYTFKFYKGEYGDGVNPADLGKSPDRTWIMKTDENGECDLSNSYKVSGDDFYLSALGFPTLPYGTVTVQEMKPPMGYQLDKTLHVRRILPDGSDSETVNSYNIPVSKEPVIRFTIEKVQGVTNTPIPGTRFTHTKPNGSTEVITTDAQGYVQIVGPETGIHKIKENQVRDGYDLNPHEFQFRVNGDGTITPLTNITSNMGMKYTRTSDGNASLQVANMPSQYDIKLNKVNDHQIALDGAEFTMYSDSACTKELSKQVTKNGSLVFKDLLICMSFAKNYTI